MDELVGVPARACKELLLRESRSLDVQIDEHMEVHWPYF